MTLYQMNAMQKPWYFIGGILLAIALLHAELNTQGSHLYHSIFLSYYALASALLIFLSIQLAELHFTKTKILSSYYIAILGLIYEGCFMLYHLIDSIQAQQDLYWLIPHMIAFIFFITSINTKPKA